MPRSSFRILLFDARYIANTSNIVVSSFGGYVMSVKRIGIAGSRKTIEMVAVGFVDPLYPNLKVGVNEKFECMFPL
jgi:hypothetical protein